MEATAKVMLANASPVPIATIGLIPSMTRMGVSRAPPPVLVSPIKIPTKKAITTYVELIFPEVANIIKPIPMEKISGRNLNIPELVNTPTYHIQS